MAGGKETPRQKMVGMMYLVLTAMLALNVSKDVLKAFVAIEDNIQKANRIQVDNGNVILSEVRSEISTTKGEDANAKRLKLQALYTDMLAVDSLTASFIEFVDQIKLELLNEAGENTTLVQDKSENAIIWSKGKGIQPMFLNLSAVQAQDKFDETMLVLGVNGDLKNPKGNGAELWKRLLKYRNQLVEKVGTYQSGQSKDFKFSSKSINDFKNREDLLSKVQAMVDSNQEANLKEDRQNLIELYLTLTKPEQVDQNDTKGLHWIGFTFDHAPIVGGLASLSSLQNDVLTARLLALNMIRSRVNMDTYSFNRIQPLAFGPVIANYGDSVYVNVMMAAYDDDNQPTIALNGESNARLIYPQNGQGIVGLKVDQNNEKVLKGSISILNKSGVAKIESWEHTIKVMKPSGSLSLPKMNILYRGVDNELTALASGYDKVSVTGSDVTLVKTAVGWIAKPGAAKTATITLFGENSVSGKKEKLLTQNYEVKNVPEAIVYFGAAKSGEKFAPSESRLFAKVNPEFPLNVRFEILDWELSVAGLNAPAIKGKGSVLSKEALQFIKTIPKGSSVVIRTSIRNPNLIVSKNTSVFVC